MSRALRRALAVCAVLAAAAGYATAQMPDVRQMSGIPLPVRDVAPGTVTVRVVRGALTNAVTGHPVELVGGASASAETNDAGRAEFTGLVAGTRVRAVTTVDGQRLESQEFEIPATGGIRLLLAASTAASDPGAESKPQAPARPGTVVLGDESRLIVEMGEDGLNVFNVLRIVNSSQTAVQTPPLVFDVPDVAENAAVMQGSSPQAVAAGRRVTVTGPFRPGPTDVQFAYTVPIRRSAVTVQQKMPAELKRLTVLVQKIGEMQVASEQFAAHRDVSTDGRTYTLAQGPGLKAGDTLALAFTGLPAPTTWPRTVALCLAGIILAGGAWFAARPQREAVHRAERTRELQQARDRLFGELEDLEGQHHAGAIDEERYIERRRDLVGALERVYAELDEQAAA